MTLDRFLVIFLVWRETFNFEALNCATYLGYIYLFHIDTFFENPKVINKLTNRMRFAVYYQFMSIIIFILKTFNHIEELANVFINVNKKYKYKLICHK